MPVTRVEHEQHGMAPSHGREVWASLVRGARMRCPNCGQARLFVRFLKVANQCPNCDEELHHHRADDAPSYFVILIVGHLIVGLVVLVEATYHPPYWVHIALWLPLTLALTLVTLPPVKGALVALQWALGMHGFDPTDGGASDDPHMDHEILTANEKHG
ncbi:MAG: DUF983 domain-containing protein [Hyphomicrobiaceae bacterium]